MAPRSPEGLQSCQRPPSLWVDAEQRQNEARLTRDILGTRPGSGSAHVTLPSLHWPELLPHPPGCQGAEKWCLALCQEGSPSPPRWVGTWGSLWQLATSKIKYENAYESTLSNQKRVWFSEANSLREPETIRRGCFSLQQRAGQTSEGKSLSMIPRREVPALTPRPLLHHFHPRPHLPTPVPLQKHPEKFQDFRPGVAHLPRSFTSRPGRPPGGR